MKHRNVSPATPVTVAKTDPITPIDKLRVILNSEQHDLIRTLTINIKLFYEVYELREGRGVVA